MGYIAMERWTYKRRDVSITNSALERRPKDIELAITRLKEAKEKNKDKFDRKHRLRSQPIQNKDWVLVYDSSMDNQHNTVMKFLKQWFGPYVVKQVYDNATYLLRELDGPELKIPIAGKCVKLFGRRGENQLFEKANEDIEGVEAEKNEDQDEDRSFENQ